MTTALITGIHGRLAALVAGVLAGQADVRVIGVDRGPPEKLLRGVEMRVSDLRGRPLLELLRSTGADVVVHLAQIGEERSAPGRETAVQGNVISTMELLGACVVAGVRRVVLRSSTLIYGARHDLPAFVTEAAPARPAGHAGLVHNYVEIERFVGDFAGKHPDLSIAVLRCAGLVGAAVSSPLARYFGQPLPPVLLGFDPRIQVLHPDDAAVAFALAALANGVDGPFNLAADDPLTLSHAIQLADRRSLPLPGPLFDAAELFGAARRIGVLPFDVDFLRYSCVADPRRAHETLGWTPQHTAEAALRELAPRRELAAQ